MQRLLYVCGVLGIICGVEPHHGGSEETLVPGYLDKVQDCVEPPPDGVTAVVASVLPTVQQVGDEAVSEGAGVGQEDVPGLSEPPSDEEEAPERDEGVPAPGPHVAGGEVGQSGRQTGRVAAGWRVEFV